MKKVIIVRLDIRLNREKAKPTQKPPLFRQIGDNVLLKFRQIVSDHIPNHGVIYLKIFMDDVISHAGHHLPWCLWMVGLEFLCQEVGCFADDFDVFDDCVVHHVIIDKIGELLPV